MARGQPILPVFLYFSVVSLSIVQINTFRPSPGYFATGSHAFQCSVKPLAGPSLWGPATSKQVVVAYPWNRGVQILDASSCARFSFCTVAPNIC
jgi:hypothetical protein